MLKLVYDNGDADGQAHGCHLVARVRTGDQFVNGYHADETRKTPADQEAIPKPQQYAMLSQRGARYQHCCWPVSPRCSPNPACDFHRTGLSTVSVVTKLQPRMFQSASPTMKFGLHPPYPPMRRTIIQWFVFGHHSASLLILFTKPLPSFPLCRAFPGSEYYDGSAPSGPLGSRCAYPRHAFCVGEL